MAQELSDFCTLATVFVHSMYTSSMAACYGNDVTDVAAPYAYDDSNRAALTFIISALKLLHIDEFYSVFRNK